MDAAIIEFDALADPVGAAAKNHDFRPVCIDWVLVSAVVSRIVVCIILRAADMHALPDLLDAQFYPAAADGILGYRKNLA